ncbi:MAG: DUF6519 domain-containing protein [Ginsengibacter sp.]
MPGDFSRKTFDKKKHYSGVLLQQGRVQLDADWNEQLDIEQYRTFTETRDVVGLCGVPKKNDGFKITTDAASFVIGPGRIYVGGLLCELEEGQVPTTYLNQPYFPNPDLSYFIQDSPPGSSPASPPDMGGLEAGTYLIYIEAWQREINYRDDALIQEKALGEADTAARLQTVWQVKLLKVPDVGSTCKTNFTEWDDLIKPSTGKLNAQTKNNTDPKEPCVLPPSAGYRSLENQLYRVEIQTGGDHSVATYKWSRDNATVETKIMNVSGSVLTVSDMGKDDVLGFSPGQWVEIVNEESTLNGKPYDLYEIDSVKPESNKITLKTSVSQFSGKTGLKLRRWDQPDPGTLTSGVAMTSDWMDLEEGVQVKFSAGNYRAGDYWLIPARTATGEIEWPPYEIPNLNPVEQSPSGINRYYCRLALIQTQGETPVVEDCRHLFPSLSDICAEDICFNNDTCDLADAQTVQEALDLLCAANDLRKHNKLLHGYGVICGLKVICGKPDMQSDGRGRVFIENGYALDCDGNIIQVKQGGISYDVVTEAQVNGYLTDGTGTVCLKISGTGNKPSMISIEKFVKQDFWDEILEGSLLKDFYTSCIEKLIVFLKKQFPFPLKDEVPVTIEQRRLTAIINLFAQLINSKSGPYGFISGQKKKHVRSADCGKESAENKYEDDLLYCLYEEIKDLLASETYCAMFDYDKYPDYTLDPGLETIFGPPLKFHTRLRLDPSGQFGYTCGKDNKIYVYDFKTQELIQSIAFPGNTQMKVQDIAFAKETTIYAVGLMDDKDSQFSAGSISGGKITWNNTSMHCGKKYVTLSTDTSGRLYAVANGEGVFEITGIGQLNYASTPVVIGNATGMLALSADGNSFYYAEAAPGVPNPSSFIRVTGFDRKNNTTKTFQISGADPGNDILLYEDRIYISGDQTVSAPLRVVKVFDMNGVSPGFIQVENSSFIHLAVEEQRKILMISLSDMLKVVCVELSNQSFSVKKDFRIPVQTYPMTIITSKATRKGYVLNSVVNTLTAIDFESAFNTSAPPNFTYEPPGILRDYREDVVKAYKHLFGHLLQSLKDCFCDKFLVDCPACSEKDKIYLGCVEIRDGKVYHICNFTKRKYVKTFPTVEYWLSTIPVLPMFKKAFTAFCCSVIDKGSNIVTGKP